jgi:hypothetical protein
MPKINFLHQGETVNFSITQLQYPDSSHQAKFQINCDHPSFLNVFKSSSVTGGEAGQLLFEGMQTNYSFFEAMRQALKNIWQR